MGKDLVLLFEKKWAGKPFDTGEYINKIDVLINKVYYKRYKNFPEAIRSLGKASSASSPSIGESGEKVSAKNVFVEFLTFSNFCWEMLEGRLNAELRKRIFTSDQDLSAYISRSFNNLLQEKMYDLTPGLESRNKQVNRVLNKICKKVGKKSAHYWVLTSQQGKRIDPASLAELLDAAHFFEIPKPLHRKKESDYGPAFSDLQMQTFLGGVLQRAGGMTKTTTMIDFVKRQFNLELAREIPFSGTDDDGLEGGILPNGIRWGGSDTQGIFLGLDYDKLAKKIVKGMKPLWRKVYFYYSEKNTEKQIAGLLGYKSPASISNYLSTIEKYLSAHFKDNQPSGFSREEQLAILEVVSDLIAGEMGD